MLRAEHRDLPGMVAEREGLLTDARNLVPEHQYQRCGNPGHAVQIRGGIGRFNGADRPALVPKPPEDFRGRFVAFPGDRPGRPQSGLFYLFSRWVGSKSGEYQLLKQDCIGCSEDGAYIVEASDILEHRHYRHSGSRIQFLHRMSLGRYFVCGQLSHGYRESLGLHCVIEDG